MRVSTNRKNFAVFFADIFAVISLNSEFKGIRKSTPPRASIP